MSMAQYNVHFFVSEGLPKISDYWCKFVPIVVLVNTMDIVQEGRALELIFQHLLNNNLYVCSQ